MQVIIPCSVSSCLPVDWDLPVKPLLVTVTPPVPPASSLVLTVLDFPKPAGPRHKTRLAGDVHFFRSPGSLSSQAAHFW